jgi:hypothetical protein
MMSKRQFLYATCLALAGPIIIAMLWSMSVACHDFLLWWSGEVWFADLGTGVLAMVWTGLAAVGAILFAVEHAGRIWKALA